MKIIGISSCFPREARPDFGVFAYELYAEMLRQGADVSVIAPYSFLRNISETLMRERKKEPRYQQDDMFKVIRPNFFNIPLRIKTDKFISSFNLKSLCKSVKTAAKETFIPDWISAYFLNSAIAALYAYDNVPIYVEMGESDILFYEQFLSIKKIKKYLNQFSGVIAVSKRNYDILRNRYEVNENLFLLENGVNTEKFVPIDKDYAKKRLGFPKDIFIVAFVGGFIERKGPLRVLKAIEMIRGVKGVFIGRGPQIPSGDKVLMASPVSNDQLPMILSACDAFVLPSLAEGLSVAILEAAACGLPLIVSDRDFNRSFINNHFNGFKHS